MHAPRCFFSLPIIERYVPGRDGDNLVVHIQRSQFDETWTPPCLPAAPGMDGVQFLQTAARIKQSVVDMDSDKTVVTLAMDIKCRKPWHGSIHFTLPTVDLEAQLRDQVTWMPDSLAWFRSDWFACDVSTEVIRIYYDGSFLPKMQKIGFAAAACVQAAHEWLFAGAVPGMKDSDTAQGSYEAEIVASTVAAKFLYIWHLQDWGWSFPLQTATWTCFWLPDDWTSVRREMESCKGHWSLSSHQEYHAPLWATVWCSYWPSFLPKSQGRTRQRTCWQVGIWGSFW